MPIVGKILIVLVILWLITGIHEIGHALGAMACKLGVQAMWIGRLARRDGRALVQFGPFPGVGNVSTRREAADPGSKILVAISGPLLAVGVGLFVPVLAIWGGVLRSNRPTASCYGAVDLDEHRLDGSRGMGGRVAGDNVPLRIRLRAGSLRPADTCRTARR